MCAWAVVCVMERGRDLRVQEHHHLRDRKKKIQSQEKRNTNEQIGRRLRDDLWANIIIILSALQHIGTWCWSLQWVSTFHSSSNLYLWFSLALLGKTEIFLGNVDKKALSSQVDLYLFIHTEYRRRVCGLEKVHSEAGQSTTWTGWHSADTQRLTNIHTYRQSRVNN